MGVAYGSLTITDLIDIATYIYYADDINGTNPSINPNNKKYIGIYSGPPIEGGQPSIPPEGTEWSKFQGEDGKDGAAGTGFYKIITKIRRFTQAQWDLYSSYGHSENWSYQTDTETPVSNLEINKHIKVGDTAYIVGVITDRNNISCMLIGKVTQIDSSGVRMETLSFIAGEKGEPGSDALSMEIRTSQEEVLKFYERDQEGEQVLSITPKTLEIELIELKDSSLQNISSLQFAVTTSNGLQQDYIDFSEYLDTVNSTSTKKIINISNLVENFYIEKIEGSEVEKNHILINEDAFIIIKVNNTYIKPINCRFGLKNEMAQFAIHATDINAAIQNTKLTFNSEGLTVQNGGIKIQNNSKENVFYADDEGNLILKGKLDAATGIFSGELQAASGTFAGKLEAATGSFSGDISAASGIIGGFKIDDGILSSTDENISIILDGTNGKIIAKNIELGIGAKIEDYLEIGDAKIYNPNLHQGVFIESGNIKINQDGTANFGNILFNGINSELQGDNWYINSNKAEFNNIDITGTIHAAAFEYGKTQVVGGSMLFKTSAKIEEVNDNSIAVNSVDGFDINSIVYIPNIDLVCKINAINNNILTLDTEENLTGGETIIVLANYNENNNLINNYLIGINSGDGRQGKFLYGRGLTLSEISEENGWEGKLKVFLGDLNSLNKPDVKGYGLYGENVFLTGSLTTRIEPQETYAGINTATPVYTDLNERIVLWAGAIVDEVGNYDIKNSPFQVTQDGSIYANKGTFKGALITDSIIQGADLYAIRIHGGNQSSAAALNIYDAGQGKGIVFWKDFTSEEEKGTEILKIDETGFYYKDNKNFISLGDTINFNGDSIELTKEINLNNLKITKQNNDYIIGVLKENTEDSFINYIKYSDNGLDIRHDNSNINLNQNKIILESSSTEITNILTIGITNIEKVEGGIDINIIE